MLGIADDRRVKGLFLSADQRDHVRKNLDDLLTLRYDPSVSKDLFSLRFLPVYDPAFPPESDHLVADQIEEVGAKEHTFRTSSLCWCDREALALIKGGNPPPRFVVEIVIKPTGNPSQPLYEDEVGSVCARRGPENVIPSVDEVVNDTLNCLADFQRANSQIPFSLSPLSV